MAGRVASTLSRTPDPANSSAAIQHGVQRSPIHALNSAPQNATSISDTYNRDGV